MLKFSIVGALVGTALLAGCSGNEELLQEKDRALSERAAENEGLKRQLGDAGSTRLVMQKQMDAQRGEIEELRGQAAVKPAITDAPRTEAEPEKPVVPAEPKAPKIVLADKNIEVASRGTTGTLLRLNSKDMFASGSADVTEAGQKLLGKVAKALSQHADCKVTVEGHTDDSPIKKSAGKWKTNEALSLARAEAVKAYLVKQGKLEGEQITCVGLGETKPLVAQKTAEARARNRRVEIVISR